MNIAIIPARGGSKRIPRKNIKKLFGKPMIAYAIDVAIKSKLFNHVIVSTDDNEIKNISIKFGAEVPFLRPKNLADDHVPTIPVISHAIKDCINKEILFENVCCIYPSVPMLEPKDLKYSYNLFLKNKEKFCLPISEFPSSLLRSLKINKKGILKPFFSENELKRSQDLKKGYFDTGQFYWGTKKKWLTSKNLHFGSIGFKIPSWRIIDIDEINDWRKAEIMYEFKKKYN